MKSFLAAIKTFAISLGGPGLFIIAFLDSSFLSFPEANDLLIVVMVREHPHRMLWYATMATLGSLAGCLAIYYVARRGGEAMLTRRFAPERVEGGRRLFQKYGMLALLIPSLLPPPAPFKIFVLLAGVANMRLVQFVLAVLIGRTVRFFGIGLLTVWYGDAAMDFLNEHGRAISLWLAGLVVGGGLAFYFWQRRRTATVAEPGGGSL